MIANYHTHTIRCEHAVGSDKEYVEAAISRGMKILGFADHVPYKYPLEPEHGIRMREQVLEEYVDSVRMLKKEYAHDIEIYLGLEAEYFPDYFETFMNYVKEYDIEYLLLGQHFLGNGIGELHVNQLDNNPEFLQRYCRQTAEAIETGTFSYFAHPDIIRSMGQPELYEREMRKLCQTAKRCNVPVEINLLGIRENRQYPNDAFWKVAGEEGCQVILGADAHKPEDVGRPEDIDKAYKLVEKYHLNLINTIKIGR